MAASDLKRCLLDCRCKRARCGFRASRPAHCGFLLRGRHFVALPGAHVPARICAAACRLTTVTGGRAAIANFTNEKPKVPDDPHVGALDKATSDIRGSS